MRRVCVPLVVVLATLAGAACQAPPVRTSNYRRVLIIGDSLFHGSAWLEGNPKLMDPLQPLLAQRGVEVRLIGRSAALPVENGWARQVKDQVATWDPDLVVAESVIADDLDGVALQRLLLEWSAISHLATAKGAEFWRVEPVAPIPGSYYDGLYGPRLPGLRFAQSTGVRTATPNRPTVIDLETAIRTCENGSAADGLHLTAAGQICVSNQLYRLIVREEPPGTPTS